MNIGFFAACAAALLTCQAFGQSDTTSWRVPIAVANRQSLAEASLTKIGLFGELRKARPGIPAHLHTGVDFTRPGNNYESQPVFPAAPGVVVSVRDDGPFAQVIVRHGASVWTVYEHFTGIAVVPGDSVEPRKKLGRFFNREELNRYGWQFDHLHFEVLRVAPPKLQATAELPHRHFGTFALVCFDRRELLERQFDPLEFLHRQFSGTIR